MTGERDTPNPGHHDMAADTHAQSQPGTKNHYFIPATDKTVHWGYFSKLLKPLIELDSGDYVTIEALTRHAYDDYERMIKEDPGAESVFLWTKDKKNVNRRGAGPIDASIHGRGAAKGLGSISARARSRCAAPSPATFSRRVSIDVKPCGCRNPEYKGKAFGSNVAAWWGFQYNDLLTEPKPREVITIYELDASGEKNWAKAVCNFRWITQIDPFGVAHNIIDYPGVPVDHGLIKENYGVLKNLRIPIRPHFGVIGLAPTRSISV